MTGPVNGSLGSWVTLSDPFPALVGLVGGAAGHVTASTDIRRRRRHVRCCPTTEQLHGVDHRSGNDTETAAGSRDSCSGSGNDVTSSSR